MSKEATKGNFYGSVVCAFVLTASLVVASPVSVGQETQDELGSDGGDMLELFMTGEQRRLLEAVRQGLLRDEQLDRVREINTARLQQFEEQEAESIELGEFISFDNPQAIVEQGRTIDMRFDGFIRIGDRNSTLLINGEFVEADTTKSVGIDFNALESDGGSSLVVVDELRKERVILKPGQILPGSGEVVERYVSIAPEPAIETETAEEEGVDIEDVLVEEQ